MAERDVAKLMLADTLGEVAMIRRARLSDAASILGSARPSTNAARAAA